MRALWLLLVLAACSDVQTEVPVDESADESVQTLVEPTPELGASEPETQIGALRTLAQELDKRPENGARVVRVLSVFLRAPEGLAALDPEATAKLEAHVANLLARARSADGMAGDFETLIKNSSDDGQVAPLTISDTSRHRMRATAFGRIGFVLDVGEIGVVPHDPVSSPRGWYIVKRVE